MVNPCIGELKRQNENPKIALLKISYGLQNWMKKEKLVLRMTKKKKQKQKQKHRVMPHSTGNYIQYLVRNYNETESEKKRI